MQKHLVLLLAAFAVSTLLPTKAEAASLRLVVVSTTATDPLALPLVTPVFPAGLGRGVETRWLGYTSSGTVVATTTKASDGVGTYSSEPIATVQFARSALKLGPIVLGVFEPVAPVEFVDPVTGLDFQGYNAPVEPRKILGPGYFLITPTP